MCSHFLFVASFLIMISTTNLTEQLVTVFFQGNHASRSQAAKYTGKQGLDIRVSETVTDHVSIPYAPQILYNLFTYNELECIGYGPSWNPFHLAWKGFHYGQQWYYGVEGTTHYPHNFLTHDNIGGSTDVRQCVDAIRACLSQHPDKKLVLFGCSRGASTVVTSLIHLKPEEQRQIKLVIAEAPFDTVQSVVEATYYFPSLLYGLIKKCTRYEESQDSPLSAVNSDLFPLDVPIAFIASQTDRTVPMALTKRLVETLEKRNHTQLNYLELKNAHHSCMTLSNKEDSEAYHTFIHSLYEKHCFNT